MFLYPEQTKFGRVLPKNKVYGHAKPSRAVRQRFVDEVEEIVWRHKLAPETLRLPAKPGVAEIQVFEIALKTGELREDVLRTIDRAVPSLIFFELTFEGRVRFAAAYKRASEIAANQPVVETYFETPWQDVNVPRLPLPVALDMAGLYEQILRAHMAASPFALRSRVGESLPDTVERGDRIRAKRRECKQLEAKLRKESQFNRKVEINANLREACIFALPDAASFHVRHAAWRRANGACRASPLRTASGLSFTSCARQQQASSPTSAGTRSATRIVRGWTRPELR